MGYPVEVPQPVDTLCAENLKTLLGHQPLIPSGPAECSVSLNIPPRWRKRLRQKECPLSVEPRYPPVLSADPSGVPGVNPLPIRIETGCFYDFRAAHEAFLVGLRSGIAGRRQASPEILALHTCHEDGYRPRTQQGKPMLDSGAFPAGSRGVRPYG